MTAFELLSEHDKVMIEDYIKVFGPTSNRQFEDYKMKPLDAILDYWDVNKSVNLVNLFGGHDLILSRPYTYIMQADAISREIDKDMNMYNGPYCIFKRWVDTVAHTAGNDIVVTDMQGNDMAAKKGYFYSKWFQIYDCMTSMSLATNAYMGDNCIIKFPSGKSMKMFKGMKPMKILHRFVEEFNGDENIFEAFRTWHSMHLNQKAMDGELCLSIHPMDYMTMSDNDNDWSSCMRWTDKGSDDSHGDYRSGTVQCMNSPYIIVAYLHNPEHKFAPLGPGYEWNSKRWRELFIVQEGIINEIKAYPFQDENLTNTCLMWIKDLAAKNLGWNYENDEVDVGQELKCEDEKNHLYLSFDAGYFMYKDIGTLHKHRARINSKVLMDHNKYFHYDTKNNDDGFTTFITVEYGGEGTCMSCGSRLPEERSERVMCDYCDTVMVCACCGELIYNSDYAYYIEDRDDPICEACFEDECARDAFTDDEYHLVNNMTEMWLLLGYDEDNNPVFYEDSTYTYDPDSEYSAFRSLCPNGYQLMDYNEGWYHGQRAAVSPADVDPKYIRDLLDAFGIWSRNGFEEWYQRMIDDYSLYYDYNDNPLFPNDDEEDE